MQQYSSAPTPSKSPDDVISALYSQVTKRFPIVVDSNNGVITGLKIDDSTLTTADKQAIQTWITANLPNLSVSRSGI